MQIAISYTSECTVCYLFGVATDQSNCIFDIVTHLQKLTEHDFKRLTLKKNNRRLYLAAFGAIHESNTKNGFANFNLLPLASEDMAHIFIDNRILSHIMSKAGILNVENQFGTHVKTQKDAQKYSEITFNYVIKNESVSPQCEKGWQKNSAI